MSERRLGRRRFIGTATAAFAAACTPGTTPEAENPTSTQTSIETTTTTEPRLDPLPAPPAQFTSDPFTLGVASGDPDATSLVLWTRLMGEAQSASVVWEIATPDNSDFLALEATGVAEAESEDAMTLHVLATGLQPGSSYIYRFRAGDFVSSVGKTKTMPSGAEAVSIGVSSCQNRASGFWQAHRDIAAANLDLMVWLGDYTYRSAEIGNTLDGFRELHAQYRSDPALQAAHASCPWLVGLDDNDIQNDYNSSNGGTPESKTAAYKAWWEHQPTRLPKPTGDELAIYRHLDLGSLARIVLFDTRQYAVPGVDLLGDLQRSWAESVLDSDHTFTVFASPVIAGELLPGSSDLVPYSWSAHPTDRDWLHQKLQTVNTPLVVSGDLHTGLATAVADVNGLPIAAELMAPAISSRLPDDLAAAAPLLPFANQFLQHLDPRQGWLKLDIDPAKVRATYRATEANIEADPVVTSAQFTLAVGATEVVPAG